jgi:hypothetical protein
LLLLCSCSAAVLLLLLLLLVLCRVRPIQWTEAVVLDMGVYCIPSLKRGRQSSASAIKPLVPAATARSRPTAAVGAGNGIDPVNKDVDQVDQGPGVHDSVLMSRYLRQSSGTAKLPGGEVNAAQQEALLREQEDKEACIHLYQVLAQAQLGLAAVFGNHLELPTGATCTGLPYYCAPAAAAMPLQPLTCSATGSVHAGQAYGSSADMQAMLARGDSSGAGLASASDPTSPMAHSGGAADGGTGADGGRGVSVASPAASWSRPMSSGSSRVMSGTRSLASGLTWRRPKGSPGVPSVTFVFCAVEGIKPLKHAV